MDLSVKLTALFVYWQVYVESQKLVREEPQFTRSVSNPHLRMSSSASNTLRSVSLPDKKQNNLVNGGAGDAGAGAVDDREYNKSVAC